MSDTAVATPAVEPAAPAPAVETAAPAPETTTQTAVATEITPEMSAFEVKRAARQQMREQGAETRAKFEERFSGKKPDAEAEPAKTPERGPDGKFLSTKPGADATATSTDEPPADPAAATSEAAAAETRAPDAPPEAEAATRSIRIALPEGHPLREMGRAEIGVATPEDEQVVRALINGSYTRRQENEQLQQENERLQLELIKRDAKEAAQLRWKSSEGYQVAVDKYHEIKDTIGEAEANVYWKGVIEEYARIEQEETQSRIQARENEALDRAAEAWTNEAYERTARIPAEVRHLPNFGRYFSEAVESFNTELESGHFPQVTDVDTMHAAFEEYFAARLGLQADVREVVQRLRAARPKPASAPAKSEAEIAAEAARRAKEENDRRLREAADRRKTNPPHAMGRVAGAARTERTDLSAVPEPAPPTQGQSIHDIKRAARAGARQDARRYFPG